MLMFFLMAMVLYPETLKKAQEEIDSVIGADSSSPPTFEHIDRLPYVVALCKEVFRCVLFRALWLLRWLTGWIVQMDPCCTRWFPPLQ